MAFVGGGISARPASANVVSTTSSAPTHPPSSGASLSHPPSSGAALSRLIMDKIGQVEPGTPVDVATGVSEDVFLQLEIRGVTVEFDHGTVRAISRPCDARHGKGLPAVCYLFSTSLKNHCLWPDGRIEALNDTFFRYNTQRYISSDFALRVAADEKTTIVLEILDSQPVSDMSLKANQFISNYTGE